MWNTKYKKMVKFIHYKECQVRLHCDTIFTHLFDKDKKTFGNTLLVHEGGNELFHTFIVKTINWYKFNQNQFDNS